MANPPPSANPAERARTRALLNLVAVVALLDSLLLVVLLWASLGDREEAVHVLGPIHGIGFLILLALCLRGAGDGRWGWWFPILVVITGGPIGFLVGDWILRRRLPA